LPEARSFSTSGGMGRFSFRHLSAVAPTPTASQSSNTPHSQLKPHFMALSTAKVSSEISGMRLAA
jgi:hypothetical protein